MNIQNITQLAIKLEELGFENTGFQLLKKISFKPESFTLLVQTSHLDTALSFQLFIQRNKVNGEYELVYYDAFLQFGSVGKEQLINGVSLSELRKAMTEVDWVNAFDFSSKGNLPLLEKSDWKKEQEVEWIVEQLSVLERSDEGKSVAVGLMLEFWSGLPYQDLFGNIATKKGKYEICQRFYFAAGQPGISVDEAYRFLQNRLLEKQIAQSKKRLENLEGEDHEGNNTPGSGNGLLKKKKIGGKRIPQKQHSR